jgi:MFS family permease
VNTVGSRRDWRYWCAYAVMIAPNAAVGLTLAAMPPILPELAARLGSDRSAQLVTSVAGFGMIVGGLFSGRLLERVGIRAFTIASLLIYGVFGTLGWFLSTAFEMGLSRFVLGMGGVFFSTAALALTAATFTGEARSRVIGMQQATSQVVNVCAVFIVGALVGLTGWRGAFLLYGAFALVLLITAILGVSNTVTAVATDEPVAAADRATAARAAIAPNERSAAAPDERPPPAVVPRERATTATVERAPPAAPPPAGFARNIAPVCALTTLMGILTVIPMAQLPFVLADNGQGSPHLVSIVLGANFVFAAISAMSFARLKVRFGKRPTFMFGLTCGMIGIALMGLTHGLGPSCVAAALAGFGTGIYNTYVFDHGVEISPPVYHGRAAGLLFAFMFFGAFINPLVAGAFEHSFGLHNSFPAMALVAVLCGLPVILRRPHPVQGQASGPLPGRQ